jgi:chromosome segregation ATPase
MSYKLDAVEVASHYAIKYGGLWKEFHQEISTLNVKVKDLEVMTKQLQHEKDNLVEENKSVLMKYKGNLSSLTEVETSNLEHKQILAIIKSEKEGLMNRLNGSESQIKWLDTQLMEVKSLRSINVSEIEALRLIIASMQAKLSDYEGRHREQSRAIDTNNQSINQLNASLNAKNEEIMKLTRAISAKDKQIVNLVKERNNLQRDDGRDDDKDGGKPLRMTKRRDDKSTVKLILPASSSSSKSSSSSSSSSSSRVKTAAYSNGINVVLQKQKERMVDKRGRQCSSSISIDDILVSVLQDESYRSNETECGDDDDNDDDDDDDDACIISIDHDCVEAVTPSSSSPSSSLASTMRVCRPV